MSNDQLTAELIALEQNRCAIMVATDLAALHRELAGNVPYSGFESGRAGSPLDRNVILPLRAPFLLSRLSAM